MTVALIFLLYFNENNGSQLLAHRKFVMSQKYPFLNDCASRKGILKAMLGFKI